MINRLAGVLLALTLGFAQPAAGDEGQDAVALRFNVIVEIDPSDIAEFESAWALIRDQLQQDGYPHYSVVSESQNQRMLVSVIGGYGELADVHSFINKYRTSNDRDVAQAVNTLTRSTRSFSAFTTLYDDELSYVPPNSYAGPFHELKTMYFNMDDRANVASLLEQQRNLWSGADIPHAFHVMWQGLGADLSSVTVMTSAVDLATHREIFQSVDAALDTDKNAALKIDMDATITRETVKNWNARVDLRVFPKHMRKD